jgi:hypothetical protein
MIAKTHTAKTADFNRLSLWTSRPRSPIPAENQKVYATYPLPRWQENSILFLLHYFMNGPNKN